MLHECHHDVHNVLATDEIGAAKQVYAQQPSGKLPSHCHFPFCVWQEENLCQDYATYLDVVGCRRLDHPEHSSVSYEDNPPYLLLGKSTQLSIAIVSRPLIRAPTRMRLAGQPPSVQPHRPHLILHRRRLTR